MGVVFSCRDEEGNYHILGYGCDPDAPSVQKLVRLGDPALWPEGLRRFLEVCL